MASTRQPTQRRKRSPLKSPPPRQAGQALRDQLDEFMIDQVYGWVSLIITFIFCSCMFWLAYLTRFPTQYAAIILSAATPCVFAVAVFRIYRARHQFHRLQLGLDGERTVGALLEDLRRHGYRVFHDVPDAKKQSFNIDHVAIGPAGIFTFETKTFSKPDSDDQKIRFDGNNLHIPGLDLKKLHADPVTQAKASADFIRQLLVQKTGRKIYVKPVLLFPGWYVKEPAKEKQKGLPVWVLNPGRFFVWLKYIPKTNSLEDIALYADRLRLHIEDCAP